MARIPNRQKQASVLIRLRLGVFVILLGAFSMQAFAQAVSPKADVSEAYRIGQLENGSISGDVYHNAELGFRYQFPHGWVVNDKATQERALQAGRQFVWGDDTSTKREKKAARQCTKTLLVATPYPEDMRLDRFDPMVFLVAADPRCVPGINFPSSVKDHEAIQRIAGQLGTYFKTSTITSKSPAHIRAFDNAGHVMLEISQSFSTSSYQPGVTTLQSIRSSILVMQARDYWVMWMFASDDDPQLEQMRATKIFLDSPATGPTENK
jgi:hypothetical protein